MADRKPPDTNSSPRNPCVICGRSHDGDCRFSDDMAFCHHGKKNAPPKGLKPKEVITGHDGREWVYISSSEGVSGEKSTFVRHRPLPGHQQPRALQTTIKSVPAAPVPVPAAPISFHPLKSATLTDGVTVHGKEAWFHFDGNQLVTKRISKTKADGSADKDFIPHHQNGSAPKLTKGNGPSFWPLWHQQDLHDLNGSWVLETEGEKCANYARIGGIVATSQPGHARKVDQRAIRYVVLKNAGATGVVYLADNDDQGRKFAADAEQAAAEAGLPIVIVPAGALHSAMPEKGSIDDLCQPEERGGFGIPPEMAIDMVLTEARRIQTELLEHPPAPANSTKPAAEPESEAEGDQLLTPIDEWDQVLQGLVNPKHPSFERNTVRRQIRAATAAKELHVSASPNQVRATLLQHQRKLITGTEQKGTVGGQQAKFKEKEWLIGNLIAMRCLTGIAAFNKVGKTKLATELVASLIFQQPFMGNPDWQPAPAPEGGHKFILWWVDQPGADSSAYLKARGLMEPNGTLHPQIVKLYTEEDDLAWDDQGMDQLIQDTTEHPGAILITDSFFACIQRIHGSDQEPEAGGTLIDIQTLLSQTETTHICLFHSPKETGPVGINAIRGHSSAGGAVSGVISLHFLEKKDPQTGKWVADKENQHRRMVFEGRGPYIDLLIRGDWQQGTFDVLGNFQQKLGELTADDRKADSLTSLTQGQKETLEWVGAAVGMWKAKDGVTVNQVASAMTHPRKPTSSEVETTRKQLTALVKAKLLSSSKKTKVTRYDYRGATVDSVGTQSDIGF